MAGYVHENGGGGGVTVEEVPWTDITGWATADVEGLDAGSGETVSETAGVTTFTCPQGIARTFWSNALNVDVANSDMDWIAALLAKADPTKWQLQFQFEIQSGGWDKIDGSPYIAMALNTHAIVATQNTAGDETDWTVDFQTSGSSFPAVGETLTADTFRFTIQPGDSSNHAAGGEDNGLVIVQAYSAGSLVWQHTLGYTQASIANLPSNAFRFRFENYATHTNGTSTIAVRARARLVEVEAALAA